MESWRIACSAAPLAGGYGGIMRGCAYVFADGIYATGLCICFLPMAIILRGTASIVASVVWPKMAALHLFEVTRILQPVTNS